MKSLKVIYIHIHESSRNSPVQSGMTSQILADFAKERTDTRLVFHNRKLLRTDIFTRATKHIYNFVNPDPQS